jgi:multisubunit Na+/H+ antiporter MnhB subunit
MEVIMRLRKFALLGAVLLVFAAFTVNSAMAQQEGWVVLGKVVQVGIVDNFNFIVIEDASGGLWGGVAEASKEDELLAVGLNAFSIDADVQGLYDPLDLQWLGIAMVKE